MKDPSFPNEPRRAIMKRLLSTLWVAAFAIGSASAFAQNVNSAQEKIQGQEQEMQEKERGTSGAGLQVTQQGSRERSKLEDDRSRQSVGGPTSADRALSAMTCDGTSGNDKLTCLQHAQGKRLAPKMRWRAGTSCATFVPSPHI